MTDTSHRQMQSLYHDRTELLAGRIRLHALRMTGNGGSSHVASILSMTDIVAVLYGRILQVDPADPKWDGRDRFILSKGHAGAGVYAALAERGFFPIDRLRDHYQNGSVFSGHVSHKGVPGVELSTGSLGHGLGVGVGMALAAKLRGASHRVFVVLSDGELGEGSNWEALLFAAHHGLENLVVVIDYNRYQSLKLVSDTLAIEPLADKFRAFGASVVSLDGHNHIELIAIFESIPNVNGCPTVVIATTTKGKGVSFMEGDPVLWHYRSAKGREMEDALKELGAFDGFGGGEDS